MTALIAGLIILIGTHSVRLYADAWRSRQIARIGAGAWRLAYSLVSIVAIVLIVRGYAIAREAPVVLWNAPAWTRHATALLAVVGFVLIAAAYVPGTRIRAALGHPMTAGIALWALGHLLANGRLHSALLFGALLVWSVVLYAARRRADREAGTTYAIGPLWRDAIAVAAGVVAALVFALWLHGPLIGVRPFG